MATTSNVAVPQVLTPSGTYVQSTPTSDVLSGPAFGFTALPTAAQSALTSPVRGLLITAAGNLSVVLANGTSNNAAAFAVSAGAIYPPRGDPAWIQQHRRRAGAELMAGLGIGYQSLGGAAAAISPVTGPVGTLFSVNLPAGATAQWTLNGAAISGATSSTYTSTTAGTLGCLVTLPGATVSAVVTLAALVLSTTSFPYGVSSPTPLATISGKTAGSTVAIATSDTSGAFAVNSGGTQLLAGLKLRRPRRRRHADRLAHRNPDRRGQLAEDDGDHRDDRLDGDGG